MSDQRPDPDALLARVQAEEAKQARGKLKIFFGAAPASARLTPCWRPLEKSPRKAWMSSSATSNRIADRIPKLWCSAWTFFPGWKSHYRGTKLFEFNLDAALALHPQLLIVDELGPHQRARRHAHETLAGRDCSCWRRASTFTRRSTSSISKASTT